MVRTELPSTVWTSRRSWTLRAWQIILIESFYPGTICVVLCPHNYTSKRVIKKNSKSLPARHAPIRPYDTGTIRGTTRTNYRTRMRSKIPSTVSFSISFPLFFSTFRYNIYIIIIILDAC